MVLNTAIGALKLQSIVNGFKASGLFPWDASAIDYSKCLGKAKIQNNDLKETPYEKNSISYTDFVQIIGAAKILEFKNLNNSQGLTGDSLLLYNLFKAFKNKPSTVTLPISQPTENDEIIYDLTEIPIVTEDNIRLDFPSTSNIASPIEVDIVEQIPKQKFWQHTHVNYGQGRARLLTNSSFARKRRKERVRNKQKDCLSCLLLLIVKMQIGVKSRKKWNKKD